MDQCHQLLSRLGLSGIYTGLNIQNFSDWLTVSSPQLLLVDGQWLTKQLSTDEQQQYVEVLAEQGYLQLGECDEGLLLVSFRGMEELQRTLADTELHSLGLGPLPRPDPQVGCTAVDILCDACDGVDQDLEGVRSDQQQQQGQLQEQHQQQQRQHNQDSARQPADQGAGQSQQGPGQQGSQQQGVQRWRDWLLHNWGTSNSSTPTPAVDAHRTRTASSSQCRYHKLSAECWTDSGTPVNCLPEHTPVRSSARGREETLTVVLQCRDNVSGGTGVHMKVTLYLQACSSPGGDEVRLHRNSSVQT